MLDLNGEASSIKIQLFNDIHEDSGGFLHDYIGYKLTKVSYKLASQVPTAYSHTLHHTQL